MVSNGNSSLCSAVLAGFIFLLPSLADAQIESAPSQQEQYGAHLDDEGWVHFGLHAPDAEQVNLLLFDTTDATTPAEVVPMQGTGGDWRIKIRGPEVGPGLDYMYQAEGPQEISPDDQFGRMFNEHQIIGDPYAYKTQNVRFSEVFASTPFTDIKAPIYAGGGKSLVYDHSGDDFPGHVDIEPEDLIVYELHVQDYTARLEGLAPELRGSYLGLAQSGLTTPGGLAAGIDHLVDLGVTAVELMPVMEYDEETGNAPGRLNHWGYMTTNFFAPEARYAAVEGEQVIELKQLIKAFHDRGIAVFLDVVYNHTGEQGPWVEQGRLAAKCYNFMCTALPQVYRPTPDERFFFNNTGTGNDVNFTGEDGRYTKQLVTDSLGLWHEIYGVDGFRFDLARILADGSNSAADWIDNDEDFGAAHLHAEPWDVGGVWWDFMDNFGWSHDNNRWAKWIGQYRDRMRQVLAIRPARQGGVQAADRGLRPHRRGLPGLDEAVAVGELRRRPRRLYAAGLHVLQRPRWLAQLLGQRWRREPEARAVEAVAGRATHLAGGAADPAGRRVRPDAVGGAIPRGRPQHV